MKVEIIENDTEQPSEYPVLKVSKDTGCTVLFHAEGRGTCILAGSSATPTGYYSQTWTERFFEAFEGKLILSNT